MDRAHFQATPFSKIYLLGAVFSAACSSGAPATWSREDAGSSDDRRQPVRVDATKPDAHPRTAGDAGNPQASETNRNPTPPTKARDSKQPAPSPSTNPVRSTKPQTTMPSGSSPSVDPARECTGSQSKACQVSLGGYPASCTVFGLASCGADGRWGPCIGSCQTSYFHLGHTVHCQDRSCNVTRRCDQNYGGRKECTDTHNTQPSNRECCPSASRTCSPTCYAGGGSCMVNGMSYCDPSGRWGGCKGSCTILTPGGSMITCTLY